MAAQKGFTLVELMVVIAIISILSVVGISVYSSVQKNARDAKRKADLNAIYRALNLYYAQNGKYPQAKNSTRTCAYGTNCYVYSSDNNGIDWISDVVPYMTTVPKDPINSPAGGPWNAATYTYSYGNVPTDGQYFDLTTQLENTSDPERCGVKNYKWYCDDRAWCSAFGGVYSNQIYELSPLGNNSCASF